MNREIRTDLAIEMRESVQGNTDMEGVRVKTSIKIYNYREQTLEGAR